MKAEVISVGTELLLGEIVDTNAQYIAQQLRSIGLNLFYRTTVGDNQERIAKVIDNSLERVDIVITSGGLGPTVDDVTREGIAAATDCPLEFRPEMHAWIEERFRQYGVEMSTNNLRQAYAPKGALGIENPVGTAPIFILKTERGVIIPLPGVPREMKYLTDTVVIPWLKDYIDDPGVIKAKILRVAGIGEGTIDMLLDDLMRMTNPTVGLAVHTGIVDVRITAKATDDTEAQLMISPVEMEIRRRLGTSVFGVNEEELQDVFLDTLKQHNSTLMIVHEGFEKSFTDELESWANASGGCVSVSEGAHFHPTKSAADPVSLVKPYCMMIKLLNDISANQLARIEVTDPDGVLIIENEMRWLEQRGDISKRIMVTALSSLRKSLIEHHD